MAEGRAMQTSAPRRMITVASTLDAPDLTSQRIDRRGLADNSLIELHDDIQDSQRSMYESVEGLKVASHIS